MEAFNMRDVLFFFLVNNIDTYCREIVAVTMFLSLTAPKTALIVLDLFVDLALMGKRLMGLLSTKYISKENVNRLILSRVFILFLL